MNKEIHSSSPINHLAESAGDIAKDTYQALSSKVEEGIDITKEYAHHAVGSTRNTLATTKEYVRRHPVPVVLGAIAFGAAVGCLVMMARRKPTFGELYADEPMIAIREALLGAISPVTQRVHKGYDSAREGAGKVIDRVHDFGSGCAGNSFSDQMGRIGNNLKFW